MTVRVGALIAAVGLWTSSLAAAELPTLPDPDGPVTEAYLREAADRVVAYEEALSRIWPGFWPAGQPFILHEPSVGAVFAGAAAPGAPEFRAGPLPGARSAFELDYPSGVPNTVALRLSTAQDDLATLFHEQFHDYQQDAFRWIGGGGEEYIAPELLEDRGDFAARADLERRVLAGALRETDVARRRQSTRTYLALRRARNATLAPELAAAEAQREWSEGTAEYVGLAGAAILADDPMAIRRRIIAGLETDLIAHGGDFMSNWFRWRAYAVGAGMAWLLDDLGGDWRRKVEAGERLDRLLEEALGPGDAPIDVESVLALHDLDALRADMTERLTLAPAPVVSREAFLATAPRRLVVELETSPLLLNGVKTSFHSLGMTALPADALALPDAGYFVMELGAYELDVRGRSVLSELTPRGLPRVVILLESFEGLGEIAQLPPGLHSVETVAITGEGISLRAASARVEVSDNEIALRIQP